ncbi:hypothetical protein C8Q80DRAFT_14045 [Daedaleopsis nitida]|nr:hypothetical protein C8Q80DRAFT_14045 [Daedaleopsis nitida]
MLSTLRFRFHTVLLLLSLSLRGAASRGINYTIDDNFGDSWTQALPVYSPSGAWRKSFKCAACHKQPASNGTDLLIGGPTWHSVQYLANAPDVYSMTVEFPGTAIYVYNVIANNGSAGSLFTTDLTFYLDGDYVGRFVHIPLPGNSVLQYDVLVYMNQSLADALHTFTMKASGSTDSLIMFDYIVYTSGDINDEDAAPPERVPAARQTPASSSSHLSDNTRILVGGIVGGIVSVLCLLAAVVVVLYRLKCTRRRIEGIEDSPMDSIRISKRRSSKEMFSLDSELGEQGPHESALPTPYPSMIYSVPSSPTVSELDTTLFHDPPWVPPPPYTDTDGATDETRHISFKDDMEQSVSSTSSSQRRVPISSCADSEGGSPKTLIESPPSDSAIQ